MAHSVLLKTSNMLRNAQRKAGERVKVEMLFENSWNSTGILQLSLCNYGRNKDCIYLTDGGPYGSNKYWGKITPDGVWVKPRNVIDGYAIPIMAQLTAFTEDPAAVARAYAKRTNNCCFCKRELTNPISVFAGYGPICAEKYMLPWDELREDAQKDIELDAANLLEG